MKKISFYIFCFLSSYAFGQEINYRFGHVNTADGLSHSDIWSLFEDSRGYLWVGTPDGLNKYNGSSIEVYKPSSRNSIVHQSIKSIAEDKYGRLWIGTTGGLSLYNQKQDRFINFTKVGDCENCLAGIVIRTMLVDEDFIWLGTNAGLSVIDINTFNIRSWWYDEHTEEVEVLFAIRDIIFTDDKRLLMATDEGLVLYNPINNRFKYFDEDDGLTNRGLGSVFQDSSDKYWLASDKDGVYHIEGNLDSPKFVHHPELIPSGQQKTTVYDFVERDNAELWIATHFGLTVFDQEKKKVNFLFHEVNDNTSISKSTTKVLFKDSNKHIWVGSPSGLDVFDPYNNTFEFISKNSNKKNSIKGTSVTAIFEDSKGFMWYGTRDGGLSIIKKNDDGIEAYFHIEKGKRPKDLKGNEIYSIEEDKEGRIWVSIPEGLHIIDWPDRSKFVYDINIIETGNVEENKLPTSNIYQIYNDENNTTWLATHGEGLVSVDANNQYQQYKYVDQNPLYASVDYITNIAKDKKGSIWLGNYNLCGGIIGDPESENSYKRIKGDSALYRKNINDFLFINEGVMISTNMGVYYYKNVNDLINSKNPNFEKYDELSGMSNDFGNVLIPQNDSLVWVSTTNGISRINISSDNVKSYITELPTSNRLFNHNAGMMSSDSCIYYGGAFGVIKFNPYTFKENDERPKVYFKNFKILNENVPISNNQKQKEPTIPVETSYLEEIELYPADKIFSVEIEVVNFRVGAGCEMQYKLEGFDDKWQSTDNALITRSNLSPGKYRLRVRASSTSGVWSDDTSLDIIVHSPWWKKPWAFLLYGLILMVFIQCLIHFKLHRERLVVKIKNSEREKFRIESSKDFHDEAGTKITRISLLLEILKNKIGPKNDAENIIYKIDQNLKELNTGMRDFIWGLNIANDNLLETILRFAEFAHLFCEEANLKFKTQPIDPLLKEVKLEITQRRHILLILKEGLNNSVKHGAPSEIELNCTLYSNKFSIELKDNGQGYDTKSNSNGNGLDNIKFRANELGAKLILSSIPGHGCKIYLEMELPKVR